LDLPFGNFPFAKVLAERVEAGFKKPFVFDPASEQLDFLSLQNGLPSVISITLGLQFRVGQQSLLVLLKQSLLHVISLQSKCKLFTLRVSSA